MNKQNHEIGIGFKNALICRECNKQYCGTANNTCMCIIAAAL